MLAAVEQVVAHCLREANDTFEIARAGIEADVAEIEIGRGHDLPLGVRCDQRLARCTDPITVLAFVDEASPARLSIRPWLGILQNARFFQRIFEAGEPEEEVVDERSQGVEPSQLAYVVKVSSADEADSALQNSASLIPPPAPPASRPAPEAKATPSPTPEPSLELATLRDSDWEKIGMGCSCSFATGAPLQEKLIAGGDGLTFFRLDGKEHLCPAPDTQAMFDGPVSMSCGSVAVQITPFGEVQPGFDGHSSKARLNLADAAGNVSVTGTWGCGC